MSGLVFKLGPGERVLINGAVIENGDRRSRITVVTGNANILRLKDAIHPEDVNTPVKTACYLTQLLLSGDVDKCSVTSRLDAQIRALAAVFQDGHSAEILKCAAHAIEKDNPYACLKLMRQLLSIEAQLLGHVQ